MAIVPATSNSYTGDGTTTLYSISFPYLKAADIFVSVNGVNTAFTFSTPSVVSITPAPANGAAILVYRSTSANTMQYVFGEGVPFLTRFADINWRQLLYSIQEGINTAYEALTNSLRSIRAPEIIPALGNAASRINKLLQFDGSGNPTTIGVGDGLTVSSGTIRINSTPALSMLGSVANSDATGRYASYDIVNAAIAWDAAGIRTALNVPSLTYVNSFGFGQQTIAVQANINTDLASGAYSWSTTTTGRPYDGGFGELLKLSGDAANTSTELALGHDFDSIQYRRTNAVDGTVAFRQLELSYNSLADLSDAKVPIGFRVSTKGVYGPGDGGAGEYITVVASGSPDGYYRVLLQPGVHGILQPPYNLKQFGAIADFSTSTMTGTDNSPALARAIAALPAQTLYIPKGEYGFSTGADIILNNPMKIIGDNRRFGSRLWFFGTGNKSVKTQYTHPDDGLDPAISTCISIESPQVHFEDLYISPAFNGTLPAGNFGADWDVTLFIKAQPFFTAKRVRVDGYSRVAGTYFDVTRTSGNCDGATLEDFWSQGFWGCKVKGPNPKSTETEILSGDTRGGGGFSDFTMCGSTRFFDMNHHSGVRASDTDGGAFYIDGHLNTPAKAIQGHKFIGTRFTSFSPWLIYVGRSSRDLFDHAHFERTTGRFKVDGVTPVGNGDVLVELSSECRYACWLNGTIVYNATIAHNGTEFYRDPSCISGTSFGQSFLSPIIPGISAGTYAPIVSSSVGGDLAGGSYTVAAAYSRGLDGSVNCQGRIVLTSKVGLSGDISIKDILPFANRNIPDGHLATRLQTFNVGFGAGNDVQVLVGPNGTTGALYQHAATGTGRITAADLANNSILHFNFTYIPA
jgi:hypothetical protein